CTDSRRDAAAMCCLVRIDPKSVSRAEMRRQHDRILNEESGLRIGIRSKVSAVVAALSEECSVKPVELVRTPQQVRIMVLERQFRTGLDLMRQSSHPDRKG